MFLGSRDCLAHDEDFRLEAIDLSSKENYLLTHTESREKQKKQPIFNINMETLLFTIVPAFPETLNLRN